MMNTMFESLILDWQFSHLRMRILIKSVAPQAMLHLKFYALEATVIHINATFLVWARSFSICLQVVICLVETQEMSCSATTKNAICLAKKNM